MLEVDCEEAKRLSMKTESWEQTPQVSVFVVNENSFNRTVSVYVKHLVCSHITHLIQKIESKIRT